MVGLTLAGVNDSRVNVYGRKPGRGLRPWLLIPKVVAVAVYFGGLSACLLIYFADQALMPAGVGASPRLVIEQVSLLFRFLVVPAVLVAAVFGAMLFMQHPAIFIRLRWLQVKLALLALGVPASHLYVSSRLAAVREALHAGHDPQQAYRQLTGGLIVLLLGSLGVIVLGRQKPTLGQNWARAFTRRLTGRGAAVSKLLALVGCWHLAGCAVGEPGPFTGAAGRPADLAVEFSVEGHRATVNMLRQPGMYVLDPSRRLRYAHGRGSPEGFYPREQRTVPPREFRLIERLVHDRRLLAEPTSPRAEAVLRGEADAPVLYRVIISGWGQINRYVTTPEESPPSVELLAKLVLASGGVLRGDPAPTPTPLKWPPVPENRP